MASRSPPTRRARPTIVAALALCSVLAAACASTASVPVVDLANRAAIEGTGEATDKPLRVGVAAILTPEGNIASYGGFATYLADRIGRPVLLVQRRTYAEINSLLRTGEVDVAFICTSAYVAGHDEFGLELVAVPEIEGATVYHSELIVHRDSTAQTMKDLAGSAFAFTDPMSTTGRLYPTRLVERLGSDPDTFFGSTFFTYSHEDAINAVAAGLADGAAVDSLVLAHARRRDPDLPVRVIHRSPPFAIPPVVVSPHLDHDTVALIARLLFDLGDSEEGRVVLSEMGVDRFTVIEDADYDSVRDLIAMGQGEP